MNFSENVALKVLEAIFPGARMLYCEQQAHGECDFELIRGRNDVAAVEVTSSVDVADMRFSRALTDPKKGANFIKPTLCKKSWLIDPAENANVARIRKHIDTYLHEVEKLGIAVFDTQSDFYAHESIVRLKQDLNIDGGEVTNWKSGTFICIAFPTRGGFVDADDIATAFEVEAQKSDNIKKLAATGRRERHLFVWVDASNVGAWGPLATGRMPERDPIVPIEITHAWVASSTAEPDVFRVIGFTCEFGWVDHGYIAASTGLNN